MVILLEATHTARSRPTAVATLAPAAVLGRSRQQGREAPLPTLLSPAPRPTRQPPPPAMLKYVI